MTEPVPPDLFAAVGIMLEGGVPKSGGTSKPKRPRSDRPTFRPIARPRKACPPSPSESAAAVRLEGGRRARGPVALGQRSRVGQPRDIRPTPVVPFPLTRNVKILSETVERLPHFHDAAFEQKWVKVGRNVERRLVRRGIRPDDALACAHELLEAALDVRATQAERERNTG